MNYKEMETLLVIDKCADCHLTGAADIVSCRGGCRPRPADILFVSRGTGTKPRHNQPSLREGSWARQPMGADLETRGCEEEAGRWEDDRP